jgi:hypothetical protein
MCRCVALMCVIFAAFSATLAAQATRAEEVRLEREAKARALRQVDRGALENALFTLEEGLVVERVLSPPRGIHLRLGGLGEGAGFAVGPAFRHRTGAVDFRASAAGSLKRYAVAEAALRVPGNIGDGLYVELFVRRRDFPQEDFFGLGHDSVAERRGSYALRDTVIRATGGMRHGHLTAGARVGGLYARVGRGTDERLPALDTLLAPATIPGLSVQPRSIVIEPFVEYDTTDPPLNPTRGGRYRFTANRHHDRDLDRFSFVRFDLDLQHHVAFFHRTRTIALRAWATSSRPDAGHEVPFYLQPMLGGAYSLRGFRAFRFRDRSVVLLQTEYRWRINEFVWGALFYDAGTVARRLRDVNRFRHDYGFGLRVSSRAGVAIRGDIAGGGGEGTRLLLRLDNVF